MVYYKLLFDHRIPSSRTQTVVADRDLSLSRPVADQRSPEAVHSVDVFVIDDSPEPRPDLQRQIGVIEGEITKTPEGAAVPPTPLEPHTCYHVQLPRASVAKMQKLRKTLTFDEADGGETMEVEDDDSDTDVSMVEIDDCMGEGNSQRPNLPLAPVIMAIKAISVIMGELVHLKCIGCHLRYSSQKDHEDCTWLPWPDMVEKYFDQALANLTPKKYFDFAGSVYNFCDLF